MSPQKWGLVSNEFSTFSYPVSHVTNKGHIHSLNLHWASTMCQAGYTRPWEYDFEHWKSFMKYRSALLTQSLAVSSIATAAETLVAKTYWVINYGQDTIYSSLQIKLEPLSVRHGCGSSESLPSFPPHTNFDIFRVHRVKTRL